MQGKSLGEKRRSRWSSQIREIIRQGKRVRNNYFTIAYRIEPGGKRGLGLVFGKRAGRPVVRNRAKRIVREHFRLSYDCFKGGLKMVVMAREDLSALSAKEIRGLYEALLKRARLLNAYEPSMLQP